MRLLALSTAVMLVFGHLQTTAAQTISVLVTYQSATGHTEKMAQGVADGVKSVAGANVLVKRVAEVTADDLLSADGVIIGSPVYFGNMSGEVKTFLDSWSKMGCSKTEKCGTKLEGHS